VDDHPISRFGIRVALAATQSAKVVGEAGTVSELFQLMETVPCDIVFVDYLVQDPNGEDRLPMVKRLAKEYPDGSVVVVSAMRNRGLMDMCLLQGAKGWVDKGEGHGELAAAVREISAGGTYVSKATRKAYTNSLKPYTPLIQPSLTRTETIVLSLSVYKSFSLSRIAAHLGCSYKIVSRHKRAAQAKIGLKSEQELYEYCRWVDLASISKHVDGS
jgi:two-component system capsular synthesis response regulator RcsB